MTHPGGVELVILGLFVFRVTRFLGWDDITAPLRARVLGVTDEDWEGISDQAAEAFARGDVPTRRYMIAKLVHCPWCLSVWVASIIWAGYLLSASVTVGVGVPFALMAIAGLVAKNLDP